MLYNCNKSLKNFCAGGRIFSRIGKNGGLERRRSPYLGVQGRTPRFEPAQALSHGVSHRRSSKLKILSPTPLTRLGHPCTNKF